MTKSISSTKVARAFGVSSRTVLRWAEAGVLPGWRVPGGRWRFDPKAVADAADTWHNNNDMTNEGHR